MLEVDEVFKIIIDEYVKYYGGSNDKLVNWFWSVGFRNIGINETDKEIYCDVERPNKFIGRWNTKIINFLVHLNESIFCKMGYKFNLRKTQNTFYDKLLDIIKYNYSFNNKNLKVLAS